MLKNTLFILGNGFDRGHNLPTSYEDFKKWLIEEYPSSEDTDSFVISEGMVSPDGDTFISDEDMATFLVYAINEAVGDDWKNFEESLGKIDWEIFFDTLDDVIDEDGDIDYWKTAYVREDFTSSLHLNAYAFSTLFSRWINSISYPKKITPNKFLTNSLKSSSIFLTFNYTKTLEDIYNISPKQIIHIHGIQGKEIIIGHGVANSREGNIENNHESVYDFGMEGIDDIHDLLRKPTKKILEQTPFFADIKHHRIQNIFSWGFSFSEVDLCYIRKICETLDTGNLTWHLHDWGNGDPDRFERILRQCGFEGNITTFKA